MSKRYVFRLIDHHADGIMRAIGYIRNSSVPSSIGSSIKGSIAFFFRATLTCKQLIEYEFKGAAFDWEHSSYKDLLMKVPNTMLIRMFVYRTDPALKTVLKLDLPSCTIFENPGVTVATIDRRNGGSHQAQELLDVDTAYRRGVHEALAKSFADERATDIEGPDVYAMTDAERLAHEERLYREGRDAALRAALGLK